jgi:hypothetical protein
MAGDGHRVNAAQQQAVAMQHQQKAYELRHRAEARCDAATNRLHSSAELQAATSRRPARPTGRPGRRHTPSAFGWSSPMPR